MLDSEENTATAAGDGDEIRNGENALAPALVGTIRNICQSSPRYQLRGNRDHLLNNDRTICSLLGGVEIKL